MTDVEDRHDGDRSPLFLSPSKSYKVPRPTIRLVLLDVLQLSGLVLPGKRAYRQVFDLWVDQPRLSFADCYHAVLVQRRQLPAM